jgi:hypothetical protein
LPWAGEVFLLALLSIKTIVIGGSGTLLLWIRTGHLGFILHNRLGHFEKKFSNVVA